MKYRCLIRKKEVPATPEEKVRQALLALMIDKLGYPASGFIVERCLSSFGGPQRRLDILFYERGIPLVLIECKRDKINEEAKLQALGYNHFVKAKTVIIAAWGEIERLVISDKGLKWVSDFPQYTPSHPQ